MRQKNEMNPDNTNPEPDPVLLMAQKGGPMAGEEGDLVEAERLRTQRITEKTIEELAQRWITEGLYTKIESARLDAKIIEEFAQRWIREGYYTDIEEARREAREEMWPFG